MEWQRKSSLVLSVTLYIYIVNCHRTHTNAACFCRYNQARKIAYIPFPFPHAQITTLFVLVIVAFMPLLMLSFLTNQVLGFVLNLVTVMCFTGLHEVARELENPFQNVPNDLPLNNFQAQFNESLMVMFYGYHPDSYWIPKDEEARTLMSSELEKVNPQVQSPQQPQQIVVENQSHQSGESSISSESAVPLYSF
jgi:predicted membrane chloride channel (bestrophin family)